jgi:periplasmic divalent cation tolerance protein
MAQHVAVTTTVERREDAQTISRTLVDRRLAACVQVIGPIESTYRWKDEVEVAEEWLCLVKTSRDLYGQVESAILEMHPYETPEIVALPIVAGSAAYLTWLGGQVGEAV